MKKVTKLSIHFIAGDYDQEGHLLGESPAPHSLILYYPYNLDPEALRQTAQQVEAQINPPPTGN